MIMFKNKKTLEKMRAYLRDWDTVDYGYVHICEDGRLLPTNNPNKNQLILSAVQFEQLINYISSNT